MMFLFIDQKQDLCVFAAYEKQHNNIEALYQLLYVGMFMNIMLDISVYTYLFWKNKYYKQMLYNIIYNKYVSI